MLMTLTFFGQSISFISSPNSYVLYRKNQFFLLRLLFSQCFRGILRLKLRHFLKVLTRLDLYFSFHVVFKPVLNLIDMKILLL